MEIRINTSELDLTALVITHLKSRGFPVPENCEVEILEDEAVVTFDLVASDAAEASPKATTPKKPATRKPSSKKPPEPEVITTHPESFVQGDVVTDPAPAEDVFPIASDAAVAPNTASGIFKNVVAAPSAVNDSALEGVFG